MLDLAQDGRRRRRPDEGARMLVVFAHVGADGGERFGTGRGQGRRRRRRAVSGLPVQEWGGARSETQSSGPPVGTRGRRTVPGWGWGRPRESRRRRSAAYRKWERRRRDGPRSSRGRGWPPFTSRWWLPVNSGFRVPPRP